MRLHIIAASTVLLAVATGCGGPRDKSMLLKDWEDVYVPLDPKTMHSLDQALEEKGVGNVKSSDLKLVFTFVDSTFNDGSGPAAIVYSDEYGVPPNSMFTRMRVWQCYEAVLADTNAMGIHVNYGDSSKKPYTVSREEMRGALSKLPRQERRPLDISIKQ